MSEGSGREGARYTSYTEVASDGMRLRLYHVYILASVQRVLYVGVSGNLEKRLNEHWYRAHPGSFSARYNCRRLVYYEEFTRVTDAIAREKQLKAWRRSKKMALIEAMNPEWKDLSTMSSRA